MVIIVKEINLIPEWYKSNRQRQVSYRRQYVALGCMFVMIMAWNFITTRSVVSDELAVHRLQTENYQLQSASREFASIKNEVVQLQKKTNILDEIDSRIDVANVLAEMSYLIDKKIVLGKVELKAETISPQKIINNPLLTINQYHTLLGDVRFKVVISGVASDASDVAKLICKLEDSPYFCQVYPSFSRNRKLVPANPAVKAAKGSAENNFEVSEFELSCYVANYRQQ